MTQPNFRRNTLVKGRVIKRPAKKFGNIRPFIYRERLYGAKVSGIKKIPMPQHHQDASSDLSAPIAAPKSQAWIIGLIALLLIGGVALFSDSFNQKPVSLNKQINNK